MQHLIGVSTSPLMGPVYNMGVWNKGAAAWVNVALQIKGPGGAHTAIKRLTAAWRMGVALGTPRCGGAALLQQFCGMLKQVCICHLAEYTLRTSLALHSVALALVSDGDLAKLKTLVLTSIWCVTRLSHAKDLVFPVLALGHKISR